MIDDRVLALLALLDVRLRAHPDAAAAGLVGVADPGEAEDHAARREVRALHVLHQAGGIEVRVVDEGDRGRDRLAQVVRRDVRRHADGDAGGAVDQQVREPRRQHDRLAVLAVVVGLEVDGVRVEVAQHLARERREPRLGVAHGRGGVVVDGAEVALAVDERVAHGEVLRQADQRVVDRRVAVRVVLAHHLADDAGALRVGPVGLQAGLVHREAARAGARASGRRGRRAARARR